MTTGDTRHTLTPWCLNLNPSHILQKVVHVCQLRKQNVSGNASTALKKKIEGQ
jgi:hypothetical protein